MCDCNESPFTKLRENWSRHYKKEMQSECSCCNAPKINGKSKAKGKFGVAYVIETPDRKCKPCGWEIEFNDTPSQIENNCKKMMKWITCPPLGQCQNNTTNMCCCSGAPNEVQQTIHKICNKPNNANMCCCSKNKSTNEGDCCCNPNEVQQTIHKICNKPNNMNMCCCSKNSNEGDCCCKKPPKPCCYEKQCCPKINTQTKCCLQPKKKKKCCNKAKEHQSCSKNTGKCCSFCVKEKQCCCKADKNMKCCQKDSESSLEDCGCKQENKCECCNGHSRAQASCQTKENSKTPLNYEGEGVSSNHENQKDGLHQPSKNSISPDPNIVRHKNIERSPFTIIAKDVPKKAPDKKTTDFIQPKDNKNEDETIQKIETEIRNVEYQNKDEYPESIKKETLEKSPRKKIKGLLKKIKKQHTKEREAIHPHVVKEEPKSSVVPVNEKIATEDKKSKIKPEERKFSMKQLLGKIKRKHKEEMEAIHPTKQNLTQNEVSNNPE